MIKKEDIIRINKFFHKGVLINENSLDYALEKEEPLDLIATLTRAILVDHVFEEGNKRTAAAVILSALESNKIKPDKNSLLRLIISILKNNITDIEEIKKEIKPLLKNKEISTLKGFSRNIKKVIENYQDVYQALLDYEFTNIIRKLK